MVYLFIKCNYSVIILGLEYRNGSGSQLLAEYNQATKTVTDAKKMQKK